MAWEVFDKDAADFIAEKKEEKRRAGGASALTNVQKAELAKLSQQTGVNSYPCDSAEYAQLCIEVIAARQRRIEHARRLAGQYLSGAPCHPIATTRIE